VQHRHRMAAGQQLFAQMRSDKPGPAGDEVARHVDADYTGSTAGSRVGEIRFARIAAHASAAAHAISHAPSIAAQAAGESVDRNAKTRNGGVVAFGSCRNPGPDRPHASKFPLATATMLTTR